MRPSASSSSGLSRTGAGSALALGACCFGGGSIESRAEPEADAVNLGSLAGGGPSSSTAASLTGFATSSIVNFLSALRRKDDFGGGRTMPDAVICGWGGGDGDSGRLRELDDDEAAAGGGAAGFGAATAGAGAGASSSDPEPESDP
jgi:hypothetical protein